MIKLHECNSTLFSKKCAQFLLALFIILVSWTVKKCLFPQDAYTCFHAQLDQKIYDGIYSQGLGPSGVSLMNLVLRGEIEEAKQLIADGADVNQGT